MAYATYEDVEKGFRALDEDEQAVCAALLDESALLIDACRKAASEEAKKAVSCRMVRRAMQADSTDMPIGVTQASVSALGYSKSYTFSGGNYGELYLSKTEKMLLGAGNRIGSYSPVEDLSS